MAVGIPLLPESRHPVPGRFDLAGAGLSIAAGVALAYAVKRVANGGLTVAFVVSPVIARSRSCCSSAASG